MLDLWSKVQSKTFETLWINSIQLNILNKDGGRSSPDTSGPGRSGPLGQRGHFWGLKDPETWLFLWRNWSDFTRYFLDTFSYDFQDVLVGILDIADRFQTDFRRCLKCWDSGIPGEWLIIFVARISDTNPGLKQATPETILKSIAQCVFPTSYGSTSKEMKQPFGWFSHLGSFEHQLRNYRCHIQAI
jgi:hypothetical protein